ncbi:MAG: fimbrillin family protein [Bacteroidales bacterium]|nr:fimbrillin family protein [Bacteroidales bacterium]
MKKAFLMALGAALLFTPACTRINDAAAGASGGVSAVVADPEADYEPLSKALSPEFKFSFSEGDRIKVFPVPEDNTVLTYTINPDVDNPSKALFATGAVRLEDRSYCAVYPSFSEDYSTELKFTDQRQDGNGTTAHLSGYDYSWAMTEIRNNTGAFQLAHKVSWIKVTIVPDVLTSFSSIVVSADDGVANTAVLNVITGEVSPTRKSTDTITLQLAGESEDYIEVEGSDALVAYITIPSDSYTNLCIKAVDDSGVEWRFRTRKTSILKEGKYYQARLLVEDPAEDTPFTRQSALGVYSATTSDSPQALRYYDELSDYLVYGTTEDSRTFKFCSVRDNNFVIVTVTPKELVTGDDYSITYDNGTTKVSGMYTIVRKDGGKVWFDNKTENSGYVIPIE